MPKGTHLEYLLFLRLVCVQSVCAFRPARFTQSDWLELLNPTVT